MIRGANLLIQFHAFSPIKGYDFGPGICDKEYLFWCICKYLYRNVTMIAAVTIATNMFLLSVLWSQCNSIHGTDLISLVRKPDLICTWHGITMSQVDVHLIRGQLCKQWCTSRIRRQGYGIVPGRKRDNRLLIQYIIGFTSIILMVPNTCFIIISRTQDET